MKKNKQHVAGLLSSVFLLIISAFALLTFRDESFDPQMLLIGGVLVLLIAAHFFILRKISNHVDLHLLVIIYVLLSIGIIIQARINAEYALTQMVWITIGMIVMLFTIFLMRYYEFFERMIWPIMIISIALLLMVALFGKETAGAKNWIGTEKIKFQPSEFVKISLVFVLAVWLSRENNLVALWPLWAFVGACLGALVLSRDLGGAAIYVAATLITFYVATGNLLATGAGIGIGIGGSVLAYNMFSHVRVRVAIWKNPWAKYGEVGGGYQIAQGLMAIASGGLFGMGLMQGMPRSIPAYRTDYVFAVICEEMGILVGICIIALFLLLVLRGISSAKRSKDRFHALLNIGCVTIFAIQSFLIIGGVVKFIPLTGVTLPFVSYGGSSMISSFILLGVMEHVAIQEKAEQ